MKLYRYGPIQYVHRSNTYCIQEKRWWGWKTILNYEDKDNMLEIVNQMKNKGEIFV